MEGENKIGDMERIKKGEKITIWDYVHYISFLKYSKHSKVWKDIPRDWRIVYECVLD